MAQILNESLQILKWILFFFFFFIAVRVNLEEEVLILWNLIILKH